MTARTCQAKFCDEPVFQKQIMCAEHWGMLTYTLQRDVIDSFVYGTLETYFTAVQLAIEYVEAVEERRRHAAQRAPKK